MGTLRRQIKEYALIDTAHDSSASSGIRQADMTALRGVSLPPATSSDPYEMHGIHQAASPPHHEVRGTPMSELEGKNLLP